jgi:repressor LexA|nr:MAG TPA: SOS-response transcriptional repressors (RecA-mediated autopeptidases) [Caudoviricetes sp.]
MAGDVENRRLSRNIKALREKFDITQQQLADVAGVTRQAVVDWERGKRKTIRNDEVIEAITSHFNLTSEDLFSDNGLYAKLHGLTEAPAGAISPTGSASAFLPLRGRVHAGDPTDPDNLDGTVELPASVAANHPHAYFLEVEGDCMDRVYPEGCYILVDPDRAPADGSIAAVSLDGTEYVMRRLHMGATSMMLSPESSNPEHADIVVQQGDGRTVSLVGTVVWYQAKKEME